jgi:hypothetical protein
MTKQALHKIENFVKVALSEISELKQQVTTLQSQQAEEKVASDRSLDNALKKAAEAMYSADFINDEDEKALFVKKAREDVEYLAKVVERVCNAADVAYMGKVATVKASNHAEDPVMRRAFGYDSNYNLLED